jgi:hypothetical protein
MNMKTNFLLAAALAIARPYVFAFVSPITPKRWTNSALLNWKETNEVHPYEKKVMVPDLRGLAAEHSLTEGKDHRVESFAWPTPHPKYVHPELQTDFAVGRLLSDKADVGIAMSGGGMRAAACTLGW